MPVCCDVCIGVNMVEERQQKYVKDLLETFMATYTSKEFISQKLFDSFVTIYANPEKLTEHHLSKISRIIPSLHPQREIISQKENEIVAIAKEIGMKKNPIQYLYTEKGNRTFLSENNEKFVITANRNVVKVCDILSGKKLAEGGVKLLLGGDGL